MYPARNLEELVRNIAHKYLTRRTKRAATSVTYPKSSSSSSVNVSVNVTSSRILPIGNLLHTSIISSHPGDVNIESSSRDIHDLSPAALATVEEIGRISYEWPKLESQTEPQANEKLFNSGCRDQQQIEDVLDSKGDSSKKNLFEDNIVWDDSSQSTSDDLREEVEVEVGNESEYLTESISDQLGDKKDEKPAEFAFEITAEKKDCLLKTSKFNFGVLCQRNENKLVDHVKLKVKRKSEEKLVPLTEKRAPRACIGKNFRYIDRFASNYIEDIDENGSSRCSKKGSSSKSQASLQCLESSKKATNGSEKLQYSVNNEQLLDKFLDKLTKGTDYPRKYPKVDGASQAVILQELLIMSKAEPPNILWQPKIEELQHVLHQAFSCHKCRASLFHPGSVIQAYVGNEVIFVCVLGCYSPTSPDHIAGNPAALDQKLEKENMLVVFDGEINHAINADFCLLPYSDDDIIAVLREQRPSPSSDCLLSANDIAFIVGSTIFKTIKSQWRLIEVEEYFQSRSFYDDKYGVLRESFKTKTKSRLEVIRLHQYFLPLTATIKNGDHCWGERRMLQLFQRAELVLSSNSSIYKIDDHGNMTTLWQTPLKISTNTNSCKTSAELKNYEWIVDLTGDDDDYPIPLGSMPSSSITSPPMMCGYELLCIQEVKCNNSDDRFVKVFHNSHKQKCLELIDRDESEEDDGDDYDDDDNNNDDDGDGDGDDDGDGDGDDDNDDIKDGDGDDGDGDGDDDNDNIKDGDEPEEMEEEFINTSPELKVAVEVFQVPTIKQTPYFERNSKLFKPCPYKESHQYESLEQINPFTGKIVHRYATKWIAAQSMQMPSPFPIIRCCLGIQKICHNFKWSFSKIKEFPGA